MKRILSITVDIPEDWTGGQLDCRAHIVQDDATTKINVRGLAQTKPDKVTENPNKKLIDDCPHLQVTRFQDRRVGAALNMIEYPDLAFGFIADTYHIGRSTAELIRIDLVAAGYIKD